MVISLRSIIPYFHHTNGMSVPAIVVTIILPLVVGLGLWAAVWVLAVGVRTHGTQAQHLRGSLIRSGVALGLAGVFTPLVYTLSFAGPPYWGFRAALVFLALPAFAATVGGLYGWGVFLVWRTLQGRPQHIPHKAHPDHTR